PFALINDGDTWVIDTKPLFTSIFEDLQTNTSSGTISRRFHNGLVKILGEIAGLIQAQTSIDRVCLSGGTFHNSYLLNHVQEELEGRSFQVFSHSEVPSGDGGLSLGQALVAYHRAR